ncbi:MAG: hypothetical protein KI790_09145 [Cyclobacteriaceae bacterium]|nr:hypothetical protein [Cyclobacteriaceae bacterium HetDA_MAG_MS6]
MEIPLEDIFEKEIKILNRRIDRLENRDDLIVFYGSSSIRLWVSMKDDLAPLHTINLGFGGSSFGWCVHYFEQLFNRISPTRIILYAGENDLSNGLSPKEVIRDFQKLLDKIRMKFPQVQITVMTLKLSPHRLYLKKEINEVNRQIKHIVSILSHTDIIHIYEAMLDSNGSPRAELYRGDQLHLNKQGYEVWRNLTRTFFDLE